MDFPLKNMLDAFKDDIWDELGPLDPDWFETLTSRPFLSEENASDQDDLCPNQEGHFKAPFDKNAVNSQLVSTPKVFRHCRIVSPETEDEQSFNTDQEREAHPWAETQSPDLYQGSRERFHGVKLCDQTRSSFNLHHTPQKSDVSYAKHISEALGADNQTDVSWTSSLNTPTASTVILTKPEKSPCPVSVSEEQNVIIVRKLFPSLSNASKVGFLSPGKNCTTTLCQDAVSCGGEETLGSPDFPQALVNKTECVWRQKLPDAIEDGNIRNTIANAIEGAEEVLSIFFNNNSSALRKAKTDTVKRKQKVVRTAGDPKFTVTSPPNAVLSAEKGAACHERLSSPSPKAEDIGAMQWSPLSLSDIPLSVADAICHNGAASIMENSSKTSQNNQNKPFERSQLKVSPSVCGSRKRKFVYSVEKAKVQQGRTTQEADSGQDVKSEKVRDKADCKSLGNDAATLESQTEKEKQHLPEQGKLQELDVSQLSRDFAQDFSQIPDPVKVDVVAKETSWNGFSPSACLSAMKQAYRKARQQNLHPDCSRSLPTTNPTTLMNDSTIPDSGFQSAVTDISHVTASSTNQENVGQSLQPSDFKMDDCGTTAALSLNKGAGKEHPDDLQEVRADARLPDVVQESKMVAQDEESLLLGEGKPTRLPGSAKEYDDNGTDGLALGSLAENATLSAGAFASGFRTASRKQIQISSTSLAKARHLFEGAERENCFVPNTVQCSKDKFETSAEIVKTATTYSEERLLPSPGKMEVNGFQLTASQKADVTELCNVLEEADSQFEFTQLRVAKSKLQGGDTDKELDSDFLSGINFDDSFSLDGGKNQNQTKSVTVGDETLNASFPICDKVTASPGKTSRLTSKTADLLLSDSARKEKSMNENVSQQTCGSKHSAASDETRNKNDQTATCTLGNDDALTLGVGFKTAGGNVLRISEQCLSKARALFADLEGGIVTRENVPTTNGKASSLSANALRKREAPFKVNLPFKHESGQEYQNVQETRTKLAQGTTSMFEKGNPEPSVPNSSSQAFNRVSAAVFSASQEKATVSAEAMTKVGRPEDQGGRLAEQIPGPAPQHTGFHMASGRGVSVSSAALRKAQKLLSDCDKVRDGDFSKQAPRKQLSSETPPVNGGFLAASGRAVTVSSGALQKARALFSDISFSAETPLASLKNSGYKQQDVADNMKKRPCSSSVGAKAPRAQNPSNECSAGAQNILRSVDRLSTPSLKENQFAREDPPPLCTPSESIDQPAVNQSSDKGLVTASERKAALSDEVTKEIFSDGTFEDRNKECKETDSFPTPNVGFQTASGKGVKISSAALKKAKILLSECEGATEEAILKDSPFKKPIPGPAPKVQRFLAPREKPVSFPKAHQGAEAHLGRRSTDPQVTVVSNACTSKYKESSADTRVLSCGFTTAGGAKVQVSQKNLLKAKKLLSDCDLEVKCEGIAGSAFEQLEANPAKYSTAAPLKEEHNGPASEPSYCGGFSTASGAEISVSTEARTKAKALLSSDAAFGGRHEEPNKKKTFPPQNSGFQTASGKGVNISSAALKKAKVLFSECEEAQQEIGGKAAHFKKPAPVLNSRTSDHKEAPVAGGLDCGFTTAGGAKVHVSLKNLQKAKKLFCENELGGTEADSFFKERDVMAESVFRHQSGSNQTPQFVEEQSVNVDCSSITETGCGGAFNTASGKRVSVSTEAMKRAKVLLNSDVVHGFSPQTGGFQTASGKGVTISSAALQKAKLFLRECEGVKEEVSAESSPIKNLIRGPREKNAGCPAANDKLEAFSEGLENTRDDKDTFCGSEKIHCGFMTAGGAKVQVTQKNLLKAKNLLEDLEADGDRCDEALHYTTPHGPRPSEPSAGKPAESSSYPEIWDKGNANGRVTVGASLGTVPHVGIPERDTARNPSERAVINKAPKAGQAGPPEVSQLSDSLEEEMLSVLEYEMNQLGSSEAAAEVEKPVESPAMHLQSLNLSGCTETQQIFLAQEAFDCTKALLEDEHLVGKRTLVAVEDSTLLHDHPKSGGHSVDERRGTGKRLAEDPGASDQPPLKRRLLEEFDRTVLGSRGSALKPEMSSPNGLLKDRRAFRYSLSLQPNVTGPQRSSAKCLESSFLQTTLPRRSSSADVKAVPSKTPAFIPPPCKNANGEISQSATVKNGVRKSATFIPPSKKQRVIVQESSSEVKEEEEEEHKHSCVSVAPVKMKSFVPPTENTPNTREVPDFKNSEDSRSAASTGTIRNEPVIKRSLPAGCISEDSAGDLSCSFLPNVELARDMQDMRIRKKKRQTIRILPGKLFETKTSAASRIPLKAAGAGKTPARYTRQQLYSHGVHLHVHEITGETAEAFRFSLKQFVQPEALIEAGGVQLADGGWLIPSEDGTAGKQEFYRSLCDTPGVDPALISEEWVHNHYRWIVWKQASMERSFPETMGGRCLTPHQVLLQLKYRYDVEVDHSRRPALRRIMERDDTAAKTLVLCVCGVASRGSSPKAKTPGADARVDGPFAVVWLTDGWYAIKAQLDEPLTAMLLKGRLAVGGKLITHGAQLVGSQDACSPLEAPESLMLKICANSSRPARWHSKLGFQRDPRPFLLPVSSLYSSGGPVGCVDIVVLRSYPLQWMERKPDGGVVFRSIRAEEREERRYNVGKQKAMEALFGKIQSEFEKEEQEKKKSQRRKRTVSRQDMASLQDGQELYEALGDDPADLEAHLSMQQIESLHAHRRTLVERRQTEVQERYRRALQEAQDGEGGFPRRDVAPVWRLCVADSTQGPGSVYQMSLWRPPSDLQSLLKEGGRYKVYNLTTSEAKKTGGSATVQLTGTKKTQFEDLQVSQEWLSSRYQQRVATDFVDLQKPVFHPLCGEVDLTGCVISVIDSQGSSPAFYLADGKMNFIKVRCFSSFAQSGLDDVVKPRALLALVNLQLRGQSTVPTPVVYAGDLTVFSTNPKETHLQESLSKLRNLVQCQENFAATAEEKLSGLIKSEGLTYITSPAQRAGTPASTRDRRPDTKESVAIQQSVRNLGACTPVGRKPLAANSSAEKDLCSLKRRRALDYLSHIPSPPHLSPLNSTTSPCVKKTFVPPRRSGTPCTLKPVQTPTPKPKPISSPKEIEWVNDEELSMIDTQTLHVGDSVCSRDTV